MFLGHHFRPLTLADKDMLQDYLRRYPQHVSGYTFATLVAYAPIYGILWSRVGPECLLLARRLGADLHLLQPIGKPTDGCCDLLLAAAVALPYRLQMVYVANEYIEKNPRFCAHFLAEEDRASANYIYVARDLAELAGGRYAKKRNLIAQFQTLHPDWTVEPLDRNCASLCRQVLLEIATEDGIDPQDTSLAQELQALDFTMTHFDALEQNGVLVRVAGAPVGFAIWERQNVETAAVHFEKARRSFKGLYQMLNRETARAILAAGFHLINREEDVGDPGLRQAKLSYAPIDITPVFNLTLRGDMDHGAQRQPGA
tara:strand:- start:80713 stop:81654 length:942 start_codon:yes stop_codon:yes gene_type:complete